MAAIEKRTSKHGETSYRVKVRLRGEAPRSRTFKRMTDARAWAAKVESDLGHGVFVPTTADRRRSLSDLIAKYITDYLPVKARNRDRDKHVTLLTWWREEFGYVTLDRLKPEIIAEARGKLAKRTTRAGEPVSGATINRYLAAISAVCKWGWREIGWLPANPVLAVSKASENEGVIGSDGGGFGYELQQVDIGDGVQASVAKWRQSLNGTARELLGAAEEVKGIAANAVTEAEQFLREILSGGPVPSTQVRSDAASAGIAWASVRRAKTVLGVVASKLGMAGGWHWMLPEVRLLPKALKNDEDAQQKDVDAFGKLEHLGAVD